MELEKQVTSLELSKKLKKLGVKQESLWCWLQCEEYNEFAITIKEEADKLRQADGLRGDTEKLHEIYSAFTVAELGEMLPVLIRTGRTYQGNWNMCEIHKNSPVFKKLPVSKEKIDDEWHEFKLSGTGADTEANARAKMLIYLMERKLI